MFGIMKLVWTLAYEISSNAKAPRHLRIFASLFQRLRNDGIKIEPLHENAIVRKYLLSHILLCVLHEIAD